MWEAAFKYFPGLFLGFLLGLFFVWWIEPSTAGGIGLILLICIFFSAAITGLLLTIFTRAKRPTKDNEHAGKKSESKLWLPGDK